MAKWLYDPIASGMSGTTQFRRPYPQDNWVDDMRWNDPLIKAMNLIVRVEALFNKPGENWGSDDDKLFLWIENGKDKLWPADMI